MKKTVCVASLLILALLLIGAKGKPTEPRKEKGKGLAVGSTLPPLKAIAVNGPYKGKEQCYVAAYGNAPLMIAFLNPDYRAEVTALAKKLDALAQQYAQKGLKGVLAPVVGPEAKTALASYVALGRIKLPVVYFEQGQKNPQLAVWKLPKDAHNGVVLARNKKVQAVFLNLKADQLEPLKKALDQLVK